VEIVRSFLARGGEADPLEHRRQTQPPIWPPEQVQQR
jgi:hypothetical protein